MSEARGIAVVVLAAGGSTRLGRPKARVDFGGRSALDRLLAVLRACGIERGAVVTGEHGAELRAVIDPAPFEWMANPDPAAGRLGSLQIGLSRVAAGDDVLMWPVDRPLAGEATVRALMGAGTGAADPEAAVIVPVAAGRRGHPILLRASLRPALLAAPPDAILRDVLRATGAVRLEVPVDDEGIHFDLDTEEAVAEAVQWWEKGRGGQ